MLGDKRRFPLILVVPNIAALRGWTKERNMGTLDVDSFTAIIFQPNSAVLAVGALQDQPVVRDGEIVVARMMKMTLSLDHRVSDGAAGARFMRDVKRHLEHPAGMTE